MNQEWVGRHWFTGETIKLSVQNETISEITQVEQNCHVWISPGLIDVQVNGFGGIDFNDSNTTVQEIKELTNLGITKFCPTIITGPKERMLNCIHTISDACDKNSLIHHSVLAIHVEGPFISSEDGPRGAHNINWVRDISGKS